MTKSGVLTGTVLLDLKKGDMQSPFFALLALIHMFVSASDKILLEVEPHYALRSIALYRFGRTSRLVKSRPSQPIV